MATQVGKTGLKLGVPVAPCNALIPQYFCGGASDYGEPMLKSFVTFVWGVHEAVLTASDEPICLAQNVHAHKTEDFVGESGLKWWSRSCNSGREASLLVALDANARNRGSCTPTWAGGASVSPHP